MTKNTVVLNKDIIEILTEGRIENNVFFMEGQLDRKTYEAVNKALTILGGKWNRSAKGHMFDDDPTDRIEAAVMTGEVVDEKKLYQFYETPGAIIQYLMDAAELCNDHNVLEPSAGHGAIAAVVHDEYPGATLTCVEIDAKKIPKLESRELGNVICDDFLTHDFGSDTFDCVVMNPPFSRQQDVDHVTRAYSLLAPTGRVVSIMSPGFTFRTDKKSIAFRELIEARGSVTTLPENSFAKSGTGVNSVLVVLDAAQRN